MNKRTLVAGVIGLWFFAVMVVDCAGPVPPGAASTAVPSGVTTTVTAATVQTPTVTQAPTVTQPLATATPSAAVTGATSTPPPGGLSETDLRYRLIDKFGNLFFCDPDLYPVAHGDQADLAAQRVPAIKQAEPEKYLAILKHLGLAPAATLDSTQTLAVYNEYKRLNAISFTVTNNGYKFALRIPDTSGTGRNGFAIEGTISRLGEITVTKNEPAFLQCPICLASDTMIDTPAGPVAVTDLQAGMLVWTRDTAGNRVAASVLQTARVAVPPTHQVVHLRLDDGRELRVSPGHPTADGRYIGELVVGAILDGARVTSVTREAYTDGATYDLLPAGATGTYWADGILLGSTLH
jgi:hypothetical protein